jgi:hypothetical protein
MGCDLGDTERALASGVRPRTPDALHGWLLAVLDLDVPRTALAPGSAPPFAYLCHAYFEPGELAPAPTPADPPTDPLAEAPAPRDALVWANRGGGKTFYAAVATVLDLLFKPGIEVRCLGGSLEQSARMHEHIRTLLERPALKRMIESDESVDGRARSRVGVTARRIILANGSRCEILAQSQTAVRGTRPQKLRCDEVELFDPAIWEAAQLVTRSKACDGRRVAGAVEAFSTMHEAHGLMMRLIAESTPWNAGMAHQAGGRLETNASASRTLFRWSALDVLERCPPERACERCVLHEDCAGRAKRRAGGHLLIEDAAQQKRRVDRRTWEAEMLCLRPKRSDAVLPEFDASLHVVDADPVLGGHDSQLVCGMDFGFRAPTVVLWGVLDSAGVLWIVDEMVQREALLETSIEALRAGGPPRDRAESADAVGPHRRFAPEPGGRALSAQRPRAKAWEAALPGPAHAGRWGVPRWVGVDPAGTQRSEQTGRSCVTMMRRAGLSVRTRRVGLEEGLSAVRARLRTAAGEPRLFVHRRCAELIRCLHGYHYPRDRPDACVPVKDGHDHAVDALRYLIVNLDRPGARVLSIWDDTGAS